jgi:hypothetical protein
MNRVAQITSRSNAIGRQLNTLLATRGQRPAQVQRRLAGLARQEEQDVQDAQSIDPPGRLRAQHEHLIEALQYRVSGLSGLAASLPQALRTKSTRTGASLLTLPAQRLLASDVVYADSFRDPTKQVLNAQGVGDVRVPSSQFLQNPDFFSQTALAAVLSGLQGSNVTPRAGGLHGTNIVSVKALPRGTVLSPTSETTLIGSSNLAIAVTIKDSGNSAEVNIPITLTIEQSPTITQTKTLPFINAGEERTVVFRITTPPKFGSPTRLKVYVKPVPGEANTANNTATYPVIFSLAP